VHRQAQPLAAFHETPPESQLSMAAPLASVSETLTWSEPEAFVLVTLAGREVGSRGRVDDLHHGLERPGRARPLERARDVDHDRGGGGAVLGGGELGALKRPLALREIKRSLEPG
jgi:hypothetical protein